MEKKERNTGIKERKEKRKEKEREKERKKEEKRKYERKEKSTLLFVDGFS